MNNLLQFLKPSWAFRPKTLFTLGFFGCLQMVIWAQPVSQTFTASGNFIIPTNYTANITVQAWGGGGAGGTGNAGSGARGGGGGGGYVTNTYTNVAAGSYAIVVGAGGATVGTAGSLSSYTFPAGTVTAGGGAAGTNSNTTRAAGGTISVGAGAGSKAGGTGGLRSQTLSTNGGGGGGGSGSSSANGSDGNDGSGGAGGAGTGAGGAGGDNGADGIAGATSGGGGGGKGNTGATSGLGGNGQVIVTVDSYTPICTSVNTSTLFLHCVQGTATTITIASGASIAVDLSGQSLAGTTISLPGNNRSLSITGNPTVDAGTTFSGSGNSSVTIVSNSGSYPFDATGGNAYSVLNSGISTVTGDANPNNNTLHAGAIQAGATVLPVTLSKFEGEAKKEEVMLRWQTSAELNNDKFIIETSTEGEVFNRIGEVDGAGTSTELHNYQFTHHTPSEGTNYYRLKQVDFDGTFAYSKVVAVNAPGSSGIFAFPNPTKDKITLQYDHSKGSANIHLFDALGRRLKPNIGGYAGNYEIQLPLGLPKGTYWLKVERGGKVQTLPVVKE